jgi:hypothetical protein
MQIESILTMEADVDFRSPMVRKAATPLPQARSCRVPRVSRMMALAIRMDSLVREGVIADYADIARLGHVSRARVTQIMNLLQLAPDIQEAILFLPEVTEGRDPIRERAVRSIAAVRDWRKQRKLWRKFAANVVDSR